MPVGNDVVDLDDPENQPGAIHPRFDRRVFTVQERRLLAAAPPGRPRHVVRWTLWAAKEAAYKLIRQGSRVAFHPRRFEVIRLSAHSATVDSHGEACRVRLDVTDERVHAVAVADEVSGGHGNHLATRVCYSVGDPSDDVRREAAQTLGDRFGIRPEEIEIGRGVPRATHAGRQLPVNLSLSHHGRFVAHAVLGVA